MDQFLPYLPKVIVSVALLYFMTNPVFRHQNTLHAATFGFGAGEVLTLWLFRAAPDWRTILIVTAVLFAVFAGLRLAGALLGWDPWILFNVTPNSGPVLATALVEKGADAGIASDRIVLFPPFPCIVVFRTKDAKAVRRTVKDAENFIRQHLGFSFWNLWGWVVAGMILLCMLWRF